jgi:methyl-accepting chemotaxis protein
VGIVNYRFGRAGSEVPLPKVSYAAAQKDWNWMVGTGVYIDDVDAEFRHGRDSSWASSWASSW